MTNRSEIVLKVIGLQQSRADLLAAIEACLPDLKHHADTHGPGPDKRLAGLVEVLSRVLNS